MYSNQKKSSYLVKFATQELTVCFVVWQAIKYFCFSTLTLLIFRNSLFSCAQFYGFQQTWKMFSVMAIESGFSLNLALGNWDHVNRCWISGNSTDFILFLINIDIGKISSSILTQWFLCGDFISPVSALQYFAIQSQTNINYMTWFGGQWIFVTRKNVFSKAK